MTSLLFVYGTLRRGGSNHGVMAGTQYITEARLLPCYTLVDLGPYPALMEGGATAVVGELYGVPDTAFPALDAFEGVPHLFRRTWVRVDPSVFLRESNAHLPRSDGQSVGRVHGYVFARALRSGEGTPIPGDYIAYLRSRRSP